MNWFTVDKSGLSAILERRGKFFAIAELVSNAWDSGATEVKISLTPTEGKPFALLSVEDNGEGFANLDHAHTLFARSSRGSEAEKRGRFNLGEKLVLAVCKWASIDTIGGRLAFHDGGNVRRTSTDRTEGTRFECELRMTRDELAECRSEINRLIPPVKTLFNGTELDRPDSLVTFQVKLPTEIADADGQLRRTVRLATVEVYRDETGTGQILEMGIPVVETENGYRVNVQQKIPLNMDRDNVTPAFIKSIQAALLNHVHTDLTPEVAASPWVQEAAGDSRATTEAVKTVITKRFGERAVVATVGDPIANANAEAAGFTVIPGGALSGDMWANVRKGELLLPASRVFPTAPPQQLADANAKRCPTCGK